MSCSFLYSLKNNNLDILHMFPRKNNNNREHITEPNTSTIKPAKQKSEQNYKEKRENKSWKEAQRKIS